MRLSRHLDKGFWTLADKSLTAAYGILFMLLVIRILPQEEYGNFVLLQATFLIISTLAISFAMSPYVKLYYETDDLLALQSNAVLLMAAFIAAVLIVLWAFHRSIAGLLNSAGYALLFGYVPLLCAASFFKNISNEVFRATHKIKSLFFTDLIYFLGNVIIISTLIFQNRLQNAGDVLGAMVISYTGSSLLGLWLARSDWRAGFKFDFPILKKMVAFGKYSFGSATTSQIYDRADSFIISSLLSPVAVAQFNAAKIFLRVFDLYKQSMGLIAFPAFSRLHGEHRHKDIRSLYEKGVFFSNVILMAAIIAILFLADFFFDFILGGRYPGGATILRYLSLIGLFISWQAISEAALFGIGLPKYPFLSRLIGSIISVALNITLIKILGLMGAVVASILSWSILAIIATYFVHREIKFTWGGLLKRAGDLRRFVVDLRKGKVEVE